MHIKDVRLEFSLRHALKIKSMIETGLFIIVQYLQTPRLNPDSNFISNNQLFKVCDIDIPYILTRFQELEMNQISDRLIRL